MHPGAMRTSKPEKPKTAITPTRADNYPEWYQQVVKRRRPGRELAGARLHGDQAVGLRALGEHPARARRHVQGDRPRERVLPAVHPAVVPREGGRARRGLRQGVRGRHAPPPRCRPRRQARARSGRARGAADRAADVARRSSARRSRSGCRAIATCRCSSTSGRTSCAGRCARACSCARPSSSGRRATRRTRPREEARRGDDEDARRLRRRSPRNTWRCR